MIVFDKAAPFFKGRIYIIIYHIAAYLMRTVLLCCDCYMAAHLSANSVQANPLALSFVVQIIDSFITVILKKSNILFLCAGQYYNEMLDSGIFVRDFGTRVEKIQLPGTGQYNVMLLRQTSTLPSILLLLFSTKFDMISSINHNFLMCDISNCSNF